MNDHLTTLTSLGNERETLRRLVDDIESEMVDEVRRAHEAGVPKVDIARAAGISRPTLDKWLSEN